jgi:hypothetical protein
MGGKTDGCFCAFQRCFQLELPFICTNEREFNKLKDKHPRTIILPPWVHTAYSEFKDFAVEVATSLIKQS